MLSDMNGLFKSGQAGGERLAAMDSSVALSQLETLDRAAWRTRFRDPSELKRAADELAACGGPMSLEAGFAALHYAWHSLALFDQLAAMGLSLIHIFAPFATWAMGAQIRSTWTSRKTSRKPSPLCA